MSGILPSQSTSGISGLGSSVVSSNVKNVGTSGIMPSFSTKFTSGITPSGTTSRRMESLSSKVQTTSGITPKAPTGFVPTPELEELQKEAPKVSFDSEAELNLIMDVYEAVITQKMYADLVANMIGHEKEAFQDWAKSLNITPTEIRDLEDFIAMMATNQYSTSQELNSKITKVLEYLPDIVQSLAKAEGLAPSIKLLEGKNPVVDEGKYVIEKVIAPLMKKIGTSLESRLTGQTGRQIAKLMIDWGEKLATLPTKILQRIGPYDIMASVADLALLAIDQATGNYRERNHQLPDEVLGIPVIGSVASAIMSVRDLLDTALGVPTNEEGVNILQKQLYDNLWNPSMQEYQKVMQEIAGKENELKQASEKIKRQIAREEINQQVQATMKDAIDYFEGNKNDIQAFYNDKLKINFNEKLPTTQEAQQQLTTEQNKLNQLKASLADFENRYAETQFGRPIQSLFQEVLRYRELVKKQQDVVNSKQTQLNQSKENDKQRDKFEDIKTIIDLYLEEISIEEAENKLIDIAEVEEVEEIINPIEIQGRTILENLFTMGEQLRIANSAIDSLEKQIADYERQIYESSVIMSMPSREVPYDTLMMAKRVRDNAEAKLPEARKALSDLEAQLPSMEQQTEVFQDELEDLINYADEQGIDLSFLEQSVNFDEALNTIQDDSSVWENIFSKLNIMGGGFNRYVF
jgi:hypothetical protein